MALDLGTLVAYIEADDGNYNQTLDRAEGRAGRFVGAIGRGMAVAGGAFAGVATAAGILGVKTAAGLEQSQIAFTTMLGSGEAARAFLDDLASFAASTPFELPELQKASQSLISIGIDADRVIPIMTTLGNVTSGMGTGAEGVKRATIAIQQMNAAGRITAEDLNQLRDAGVPVYDLLAAATGKSVEQVAELARTGKLGREELDAMMQALESGEGLERFNGMMEAQSQSLLGLWSTLKDTVSMGLADAVQPLLPLLKDGLGFAIAFAADQAPRLKTGLETIVTGVTSLVDVVRSGGVDLDPTAMTGWERAGAIILQVKDWVMEAVDSLRSGGIGEALSQVTSSTAGGSGVSGIFDAISSGVSSLIALLPSLQPLLDLAASGLEFLADNADTVAQVLPYVVAAFLAYQAASAANTMVGRDSAVGMAIQLGSSVALVIANRSLAASYRSVTIAQGQALAATRAQTVAENTGILTRVRSVAAIVAQRVAQGAAAAATGAMTAAQWLLNAAMSANPIGLIVIALVALVAGLVYAWNNSETFRNIVLGAWDAIKTGVGTVVDWLTTAVPAVFAWIKNAFLTYTPLGIIISHWDQIRAFIASAVDRAKAIIAWFGELPGKFADWFGRARDAVNTKVSELVSFVTGLPGKIVDALGDLGSLLYDKGSDLVQGMINGISGMAKKLRDFVSGWVKDNIPGPIAKALGISSPSKVAAQLTRWVPLGAIEGLKETGPRMRSAVEDLFSLDDVRVGRVPMPAVAGAAAGAYASRGFGADRLVSREIRNLAPVNIERVYGTSLEDIEQQARERREQERRDELAHVGGW